MENRLDTDSGGIWAILLRKSSVGTTMGIPERGIDDDPEESATQFLEFALDVDDESRCDSGKRLAYLTRNTG